MSSNYLLKNAAFGVLPPGLEEPDVAFFAPAEIVVAGVSHFTGAEATAAHELHGDLAMPVGRTGGAL